MESGPEDHKLLVPEALLKNRVQLSEVRPNRTVSWLGHLAYEVLVEVDQQFSGPRGHDALICTGTTLAEATSLDFASLHPGYRLRACYPAG